MNPKMSPDASLVPELSTFTFYSLFFFFGWFLFQEKESISTLTAYSWPFLALGLALSVWVFKDNTQYTTTGELAQSFISVALTFGILGFAFKLLAFSSPILSFVVQSSYWVYLSHYPLVVALHVAFASLNLNVFAKYTSVLSLTLAFCFSSALLVRKMPFALVLVLNRTELRSLCFKK
jgi:glucans biosynthesis protein C